MSGLKGREGTNTDSIQFCEAIIICITKYLILVSYQYTATG